MNLLAIETATEACSVALAIDGDIRERFEIAPRGHAERVLPWIEALLAEAGIERRQLDAIAVGRGPGAFTGVRLAVALAQGLALALGRPLVPVSTLAALALQADAAPGTRVLAALDARMGEVYLGEFEIGDDGLPRATAAERLLAPSAYAVPSPAPEVGVGTGFGAVDGTLARVCAGSVARIDPAALPHAAAIARLGLAGWARGEALPPERVEPAYLRDKVAQTLAERGKA